MLFTESYYTPESSGPFESAARQSEIPDLATDEVLREIFKWLNVKAQLPAHTAIYQRTKYDLKRYESYIIVDPLAANEKYAMFRDVARGMARIMPPGKLKDFGVDADGNIDSDGWAKLQFSEMDAAGVLQTTEVRTNKKPRTYYKSFRCKPCKTSPVKMVTGTNGVFAAPLRCPKCDKLLTPGAARRYRDDKGRPDVEPGTSVNAVSRRSVDYQSILSALRASAEGNGAVIGTAEEITDRYGKRFTSADIKATLRRFGFKRSDKCSRLDGKKPALRYSLTLDKLDIALWILKPMVQS